MRRTPLPFAAAVLASSDDPYCSIERAAGLAAHWGAGFENLGPLGHLNGDSGLGEWPEGLQKLHALARCAD